jgi:agmatine deiminase
MKTPNRGYRMPAEWERHEATWLSWPKDPLTFPRGVSERVERTYVEMVRALTKGERVNLLVDDSTTEKRVRRLVGQVGNLFFYHIKTADVWTRDYAPIFVRGKRGIVATKWIFNAWGNKYDELKSDNKVGMEIAKSTGLRVLQPGIVLEGGSVDVNGRGLCLTSEECLLNKNRNPRLGRERIQDYLKKYLGITNVVWLRRGIVGDDTDGHVDDIARFVSEDTVLCMVEDNPKDENHARLAENFGVLSMARNAKGESLRLIPVKMPGPVDRGGRLPASYANFYIGNSVVLVPTFNHENDESVLTQLRKVFPGRKVLGIDCRALVYGFGGIHCVTQQQPSA